MTGFAFLVGLAGSTITVLCSGGKSLTDKIKIEVYGYRKTGNSIKISFNFNHLILYRISVWLVSLVFFFFFKKINFSKTLRLFHFHCNNRPSK